MERKKYCDVPRGVKIIKKERKGKTKKGKTLISIVPIKCRGL